MCGFCGYFDPGANADAARARIARMTDTLAARGPDAAGVYVADDIALGHRRLSILDLSPSGAQPMLLPSAQLAISYNGEAYNFADLRRELEAAGHAFRGRSDTEVILHAYAQWGLDGLRRLEGIFAFALWDATRQRLVLMRDRLGIKPLFYAARGAALAFGSEIKAVLAAGDIERDIDSQAFMEYLWYGNAFEDRTIFAAVRALPPGHWLIVEDGRLRIEPWWKLEEWLRADTPACGAAECALALRDALDKAVARQLVADVPVGIFLSGGVDSSSIAAAAARVGGQSLSSYSAGFDFERGVQELPKARRIAHSLGLNHHELTVKADDLQDVLVSLVRAHDEPFADAANIPLYLLARELGGAVKVVLQGDGGDEMFAGYRRYSMLRYHHLWRVVPGWLSRAFHTHLGAGGVRFARMADAAGNDTAALRMALLLTVETLHDPPTAVLDQDVRNSLERRTDPFLAFRRCAARFAACEPVQQMLLTDLTLQLPSQFLTKVDRATMAQGIEARVPLLDERVAELAIGMRSELKVRGTQKKIILRQAMRGRVPDDVLDGPKTGFGVPYEHWLRTTLHDFARDAILAPQFIQRHGLDRRALERALADHRAGRRERGFLLWKFLQLALWSSLPT
jgi:asparagine synthase (glutamine-hydrolysing)